MNQAGLYRERFLHFFVKFAGCVEKAWWRRSSARS